MNENRCVCCGEVVREGDALCLICKEVLKKMPTDLEAEVVLWRPFPLIIPRIAPKEYLVTTKIGSVYITLWDGSDWLYRPSGIIAWANVPSPYEPINEKTDERKKGKWIRNSNGTYSCSLCQSWIPNEQRHYANFCLFCDADMREEEQHGRFN